MLDRSVLLRHVGGFFSSVGTNGDPIEFSASANVVRELPPSMAITKDFRLSEPRALVLDTHMQNFAHETSGAKIKIQNDNRGRMSHGSA